MQLHSQTIYPVDLFDNANLGPDAGKRTKCFAFDSIGNRLFQAGDYGGASVLPYKPLLKIVNAINYATIPYAFPAITLGGGGNVAVSIETMAYNNDILYIAGLFDNVGGQAKNGLAAIQISSGTVLSWNPSPGGNVTNLLVDGGYLYVTFNSAVSTYSLGVRRYNISGLAPDLTWSPNLATLPGSFIPAPTFGAAAPYTDKLIADGTNLYRLFEGDIYKLNKTNNNISPLYNYIINQINDFTIQNGKAYIVGNFISIYNLSNVAVNRNNAACITLSTSTFTSWNPDFSEPQQCVAAYGDTILVGNNTFNPATVNGSINLTYYLNHVNSTTGTFVNGIAHSFVTFATGNIFGFLKFHQYNDRILALEHDAPRGAANQNKDGYYGDPYCLHPRKRMSFLATNTNICPGTNNVIYKANIVNEAASYNWAYSGAGVTITGNGTATVSLNFGGNATSGNLTVQGTSGCGYTIPSASYSVNVYPNPVLNTSITTPKSCFKYGDTIVTTSPSILTYTWNKGGAVSGSPNKTIVTDTGTYVLTTFNPSTSCTFVSSFKITSIAPNTKLPSPLPVLTCLSNSLSLNVTTINPLDSLVFKIPGTFFSNANPCAISNSGTYIFEAHQKQFPACTYTTNFTVTEQRSKPNITTPSASYTLNCLADTMYVKASSDTANTILNWTYTTASFTSTPSNIDSVKIYTPGSLVPIATNTVNGCQSSPNPFIVITEDKTLPNVGIAPGNYDFNCSQSLAVITGTTNTFGANLNWTGPSSFSSPNPATVNVVGNYTLTADNPVNGCTKTTTINVAQNNVLLINAKNDTLICNGSSALLGATPIGGTAPFVYSYSSGSATVNPTDTTQYMITITDNIGCVGKDSMIVNVPSPLQDSTKAFKPCDPSSLGSIVLYPYGSIAPYQYSINGGATYTNNPSFLNLAYGSHQFVIKDALGCIKTESTTITANSSAPQPNFLISSNQFNGDSIVAVDISQPKPDSVQWAISSPCSIQNVNNMFSPNILCATSGSFVVTMQAFFGTCQIAVTKTITITPFDTTYANGTNNNGIESITLYPNPNTGTFTADVKLYKKQSYAVFIYNATGTEFYRQSFHESDFNSLNINLNAPQAGTYIFKVIAEYDAKSKPFIIGN